MDSAGNLYIDDEYNNVIEKVTPAGHLSVVAGVIGGPGVPVVGPATSSPLENPYGLAVDSAGDIYIAMTYYFGPSFAGNMIRVVKVTSSGQLSFYAGNGSYGVEVAGPALSSPMTDPGALAVDSTGDLYIADAGALSKVCSH